MLRSMPMHVSRALPALAVAASLILPAGVASAADTPLLRQSALCLDGPDVPICLLRGLAPHPFSRLIDDADLLAHPTLLREAGVSIEAERSAIAEARLARGEDWVEALPEKFVVETVLEAVLRAERGMPAEAVLEPIRRQPLTRVKEWDKEGVAPSPRLLAYLDFWPIAKAGLGGASNGRLKEKLLEFWSADLASREIGRAYPSDVGYVEMSAAEAKALTRLIPQERPPEPASTRITALLREGKLDEALAALQKASISREPDTLAHWGRERIGMATLMTGMLFGSVPDEEDNQVVLAKRLLAMASLQLTKEAQKAGRADVARAAADYFLQIAPYGAEPLGGLSLTVFSSASPAVAERWLDRASAEAPASRWRAVDTILTGWRATGRSDRAEAVHTAAFAAALQQASDTSPYTDRSLATTLGSYLASLGQMTEARRLFGDDYEALIRADLDAGRASTTIDGYLAEHPDPAGQAKVLKACAEVTAPRLAAELARRCLERWPAGERTSTDRLNALRAAVGLAGNVAARDLAMARSLMRFALNELAEAAPSAEGDWEPPEHALLAYAKAELRADGRLPAASAD
jgi:hypothetical protein